MEFKIYNKRYTPPHFSYAAVVIGTSNTNQQIPVAQTPLAQAVSEEIPQRNQTQRSYNSEEMDNPFFLSPNDSPCTILVNLPLSGSSNYGTWSVSMRMALEIKNKWGLVDGSIVTPSRDDAQYLAWRRCNLIVCSWLFKSVDTTIAQSIIHFDKCRDIWEDLRKRFSQCDAQRISILQSEIYNLRQGTLSISDYYTKSCTLWEQMNTLRSIPICRCNPRCSCGLTAEVRKERDTDKVFVMAEKLERQINFANLSLRNLDISHANAVQNVPNEELISAVNNYNETRLPPGWVPGFKSKGKQQVAGAVTNNVGDLGISSDQLFKIMSILQPQTGQSSGTTSPNTSAAVHLTPTFDEQQLNDEGKSSILHINSLALCSSTWILDSGATNHIVCSLDFMVNRRITKGTEVNLPTGQCVPVTHMGDVKLNDALWLKDALCIPSFKFNIVSVSKLVQHTKYKLIFMDGQCSIQEKYGQKVGLAKHDRGLYILTDPPSLVDA
ncbi:PREDICTED: uncharacterized protein LOC109159108 [Ipomoea nil]|uniref:uncharacterized protein LOC109159108 n=1 Tax=Ipomoea nil TaxID=35883 RepID=UPI0009012603|nr:PREDICTED: uncharacterized protein LOC109159108 [Ipomoea nil]